MKIYLAYSYKTPQNLRGLFHTFFEKTKDTILERRVPEDPTTINLEEAENYYQENYKKVKSADLMIAEVSYVSIDVGHDILLAIQEKKPVIVLYNMTDDIQNPRHITNVPLGLQGNRSKYILLREYNSRTLDNVLRLALEDAKELLGTKFNLILPPELDRFLEWTSKNTGIPKSETTRHAIQELMEKNDAYMNYLKESGLL
jgi:hypothetical protein